MVPAILNAGALDYGFHIMVRLTVTKLKGKLCKWIKKHPDTLHSTIFCR